MDPNRYRNNREYPYDPRYSPPSQHRSQSTYPASPQQQTTHGGYYPIPPDGYPPASTSVPHQMPRRVQSGEGHNPQPAYAPYPSPTVPSRGADYSSSSSSPYATQPYTGSSAVPSSSASRHYYADPPPPPHHGLDSRYSVPTTSYSSYPAAQSSQNQDRSERVYCELCGKSFSRAHDRKRHYETQHAAQTASHRCPHCGKSFSRQDSLKRHLSNGCEQHRDGQV